MHTFIYLNFLNFRFIGNSEIQSLCWPSPQVHLRYEVSQQDMKEEERVALVDAVAAAGRGARVVITHGTDTMLETARYLAARLDPAMAATVLLTGAFLPEVEIWSAGYLLTAFTARPSKTRTLILISVLRLGRCGCWVPGSGSG